MVESRFPQRDAASDPHAGRRTDPEPRSRGREVLVAGTRGAAPGGRLHAGPSEGGDPTEAAGVVAREAVAAAREAVRALAEDDFALGARQLLDRLAAYARCDRVTLGFGERLQAAIVATGGPAAVNERGESGRRAVALSLDEAMDQSATIVFPAPPGTSFVVDRAHGELARHGIGAACTVPLEHRGRVVGALCFERTDASAPFRSLDVALCESMAALVGPVVALERLDRRSLAGKCSDAAHRSLRRLVGPTRPLLKLSAIAALLLLIFLCVANGEYRVSAPTVLEGEVERVVAAPFDGFISEASFRAGDEVAVGDVICRLDDRELNLERLRLVHELGSLTKQQDRAFAERKASDLAIVRARMEKTEAELALVEDQLARAAISAPMSAVIVEGDLSHSIGAPVERGAALFRVAPLEGFRVIVKVDERDVAEVAPGQVGALRLAAYPTRDVPLVVVNVTPVSIASEGRNYFRVEASCDAPDVRLRPGMEGLAKIEVGRRRLIWIWTHRLVDWLRVTLWEWLP